MATITEDYVSFETAKLLKEKGFDEYCPKSYFKMNKTLKESGFSEWEKANEIKAPTQSLAMKWLRKIHNIFIVIEPHMYDYINERNSSYVTSLWQGDNYYENITSRDYPTYEEACEAVIKYCLENLI